MLLKRRMVGLTVVLCLSAGTEAWALGAEQGEPGKRDRAITGSGGISTSRNDDLFMEMLKNSSSDGRVVPPAGEASDCVAAVEAECISIAPEPSAMLLMASGLIGIAALGLMKHRRRPSA